ncbi:hypothetical protein GRF29_112g1346169 [Pseudopithomyces chartarum]|uniref:Uncharacterized protein n=1 Tax=Pseudopithomyces chartarum TaxID=1892770 RepID=A0AAN6REE9_9PLEO|nr:hypothetical protein GRF29_112g1346169 [Pseudopithomyces chartarum]
MDATITFKPHDHLPLRTLSQPPSTLLLQSLTNLVTLSPPETAALGPRKGLYQGPLSIAYLFYHLSHSHPQLLIQGKTPSQWFTAYLIPPTPASKLEDENEDREGNQDPPHTGIIDENICYLALLSASTQNTTLFLSTIEALPPPPSKTSCSAPRVSSPSSASYPPPSPPRAQTSNHIYPA